MRLRYDHQYGEAHYDHDEGNDHQRHLPASPVWLPHDRHDRHNHHWRHLPTSAVRIRHDHHDANYHHLDHDPAHRYNYDQFYDDDDAPADWTPAPSPRYFHARRK